MRCITVVAIVLLFSTSDRSLRADEPVDYFRQIKPLLADKCYSCHGALKQEGGLRLETLSLMHTGGDGGSVLVAGDAYASPILQRVTADEDSRMPPAEDGARLRPAEISLLRRWIQQGASAPDEDIPQPPEQHWAFRAIVKPALPPGATDANPIDALLQAKQAERGLQPQPPAERPILLRRLYLDLIGLPPSLEQLHDQRPWNEIVDELLASPHHGERWGRHWMDVWRYSDDYGLGKQLRYSQKHLWHWRDWIVSSLNSDKGYDRMIQEMLAGDELAPADMDAVSATGFLARNYYLFNRTTWLDSTIEHTGKAFLGLTLNCAKCHDHKYDPISNLDYYRFRAIFEPHQVRLDPVPGVVNLEQDGVPRVFDDHIDARTFLHVRGNPKNLDKKTKVGPAVPAVLSRFQPQIQQIRLPPESFAPGTRRYVQQDQLNAARRAAAQAKKDLAIAESKRLQSEEASTTAADPSPSSVEAAKARLRTARARLKTVESVNQADAIRYEMGEKPEWKRAARRAAIRQARWRLAEARLGLVDADEDVKKVKVAREAIAAAEQRLTAAKAGNGQYTSLRVSRKSLESPAHQEPDYAPVYSPVSTGRRLALARWMTAKENPLTARVAVNHVWMRHFGEPLVESVFDFGLRTPRPVHADVLDFLSAQFMESGWSFKHLHRLIVTSSAWQQSSSTLGADPTTLSSDPDNKFYWRMHARRMESQIVRDSLLHLAGQLDATLGGPSMAVGNESRRRSIYFRHSRDDRDRFLAMFDDADLLQCYRRSESIVPQQALALANSQLAMGMAEKIAEQVVRDHAPKDLDRFAAVVFELLLGRQPDNDERRACREYCGQLKNLLAEANEDASGDSLMQRLRIRLVHVVLNHNDFITVR